MILRLIKYAAGGLGGFLLDMFFVNVFIHYGISYNISIVLGFVIAAWVFSYFFHRHVTFEAQDEGEHGEHFSKFSIVTTIVFVLDVGMALLFSNILLQAFQSSPPLLVAFIQHTQNLFALLSLQATASVILVNIGKILGALIGGVGHYILLHFWVFKKKSDQTQTNNDDVIHRSQNHIKSKEEIAKSAMSV